MDSPPRKRILPKKQRPPKKCHIGQPQLVLSNQQNPVPCGLCHQSLVTIERSFGTSGSSEKTVLLICGECSGILENLDKFRKQAFCSFRLLLDRRERVVQSSRVCRFCFVAGDGLVDLFDEHGKVLAQKLLDQVREWLEIEIDSRDAVTTLCRVCIRSVLVIATLRIGPSTSIGIESSKYMKKKQAQERRDAREEADQNLLELLQAPHEGRNFSVQTANIDPTMQVVFQGHQYRLVKQNPSGITSWKCVFQRLHHCNALIEINPEGTAVTSAKTPAHSHPVEPDQLLQHPQGKFHTTVNGTPEQPFYLTHGASGKSPYTRTLFVAGHRYYLMAIRNDGTGSNWCCNRSWDTACKVRLNVDGLFVEIHMRNELHPHEPYRNTCIERYLRHCGVEINADVEKMADVTEEEKGNRVDAAESAPIENIEQQVPPTRTTPIQSGHFSVKQTANHKVQITFNGHDFRWADKSKAQSWCCVWHEIRRCPVRIQLSPDGKMAALVDSGQEHNHSDEVIAIFWHKFGKNVVFDEQEGGEFYYRLFEDKDGDWPNRWMEFQGYRYGLASILDNGDSVWKCERCEGTVRVMGLFWIVDYRCVHDHAPLTLEEVGFDEDLLPYKSTGTTNSIPRSPSALLKLLSIDEPERNFQMHYQGDLMKILQDGYEYFYSCSKPNYSLWKCFYSSIRGCGATLHVENLGRIGTPSPFSTHNHSIELWDLYYHRLGEGSILNESTNAQEPFFFLIRPDFMRPLPHVIHEGHLLTMIFITEHGERSKWRCVAEDCPVVANVTGLFERISVEGLPHCDEPLGEEQRRQLIREFGTPDEF